MPKPHMRAVVTASWRNMSRNHARIVIAHHRLAAENRYAPLIKRASGAHILPRRRQARDIVIGEPLL